MEGESGKRRCKATSKSTGEQCKKPPMLGSTVCAKHGGAAPQVRKAAAERQAKAELEKAAATFGLPRDVDPTEALLEEVRWTAGHVAWLREKVQALEESAVTWGVTKETASNTGIEVIQAAGVNILVQLYQQERKHLVDVCATAIRVGIDERRVKLAEQQGALVADVVRAILDSILAALTDAGLPKDLRSMWPTVVADVVPAHFRRLAAVA